MFMRARLIGIFIFLVSVFIRPEVSLCEDPGDVVQEGTPITLARQSHSKLKLFAGAAFPLGDFGSKVVGVYSGYARTGFVGGVGFAQEFAPHVGYAITGKLSVHAQDFSESQNSRPDMNWDPETRVFAWLTGGFYVNSDLSDAINLYSTLEGGALYSKFGGYTHTWDTYYEIVSSPGEFTFAYKLAAGASFGRYDFNFSYCYSQVIYDVAVNSNLGSGSVEWPMQSINVIDCTVGYIIN